MVLGEDAHDVDDVRPRERLAALDRDDERAELRELGGDAPILVERQLSSWAARGWARKSQKLHSMLQRLVTWIRHEKGFFRRRVAAKAASFLHMR